MMGIGFSGLHVVHSKTTRTHPAILLHLVLIFEGQRQYFVCLCQPCFAFVAIIIVTD